MNDLTDLFQSVAGRVKPPVCVALGPPWPVANLVEAVAAPGTVCYQMDLHQADRVRDCLAEVGSGAEVVAKPDLWDLGPTFETVVFPAAAYADRELKIDMVEQAYHVLKPGGVLVSLSGYERDNQFAKWHKKVFGKCGQTPASKAGMAFWSVRGEDQKRRRHEVAFHAKLPDGPPMEVISRPGTFSYGRFDNGSRAMVEVADVRPGESVLDLGCGNGAVGCLLGGKVGPAGSVTFVDSNLRAVALAELNAAANNTPNPKFVTATRLEGLARRSFDVIVANPPYYAKSEITQLFVQGSRELLRPGGRYYIVTKLPTAVVPMIFQTFGDCSVIENRGYSVVMAGVGGPPPLAGGMIPRVV
ncbi:MAG: methyltransferase [Gemmataceae bacterium]|nr:methyltransferase [Gemmataceae bacterium]